MANFADSLLHDLIRDPTNPGRVIDLAKELLETRGELKEALENYKSAKDHYKTQVSANLEMIDARDKAYGESVWLHAPSEATIASILFFYKDAKTKEPLLQAAQMTRESQLTVEEKTVANILEGYSFPTYCTAVQTLDAIKEIAFKAIEAGKIIERDKAGDE